MGLFGRKMAAAPSLPPLLMLELVMVENTAEFRGSNSTVAVHGFDLEYAPGRPMFRDEDGAVEERVFYFRVAGVGRHQAAAQSAGFAPGSRVFLLREPTNPVDPNAVQVLDDSRRQCGYVPKGAAASMSGLLDAIPVNVAIGIVTKTFAAHGRRNAIEVVAGIARDIGLTGRTEDGGPTAGDDRWRLGIQTD